MRSSALRMGDVEKALQLLNSARIAPASEETFQRLRDCTLGAHLYPSLYPLSLTQMTSLASLTTSAAGLFEGAAEAERFSTGSLLQQKRFDPSLALAIILPEA